MNLYALIFLALLLGMSTSLASNATSCRASKIIVGPCFMVHGRLLEGNGTPAGRIWPIGTKRLFGVVDGDGHDETGEVLPPGIIPFDMLKGPVFGNFEVCPLTRKRPGWMQMVCIKRASKLFQKK